MGQFISDLLNSIFIKIPLGLRIAVEIDSILLFFTSLPKNTIDDINLKFCDESRHLEENYYKIQLAFEIVILILSSINLIIFSIFFNLSKRENQNLNFKFTIVNMIISAISFIFAISHLVIINNVFSKCKENEEPINKKQYYPIVFNFLFILLEYFIDLFNIVKQKKITRRGRYDENETTEIDQTIEDIKLNFDKQNIEEKKLMINKLIEKKQELEEKYRKVETKYNEIDNLIRENYRNNEKIEELKRHLKLFNDYEPELARIRELKEGKKKEIDEIKIKNDQAEKLILTWSSISNEVTRLTTIKDIIRKKNDTLKLKHKNEEKKLEIRKLNNQLDILKEEEKKVKNDYNLVQNLKNQNNLYEKRINELKQYLNEYSKYEPQFLTIRKLKEEKQKEINDIKNNQEEEIIFEWVALTNEVARLTNKKDSMRR